MRGRDACAIRIVERAARSREGKRRRENGRKIERSGEDRSTASPRGNWSTPRVREMLGGEAATRTRGHEDGDDDDEEEDPEDAVDGGSTSSGAPAP